MQLSDHFSYEEMTFSEQALRMGIDNTPDEAAKANLVRVCQVLLEPARKLLGCAIHVNSGYRSPAVNAIVGSTASHSAHLDGRAADFVPIGVELSVAFYLLRKDPSFREWDQLIFECKSWIHVSVPAQQDAPRHEALMASGGPGNWTYSVVA
jgi:hypothetical protein